MHKLLCYLRGNSNIWLGASEEPQMPISTERVVAELQIKYKTRLQHGKLLVNCEQFGNLLLCCLIVEL